MTLGIQFMIEFKEIRLTYHRWFQGLRTPVSPDLLHDLIESNQDDCLLFRP